MLKTITGYFKRLIGLMLCSLIVLELFFVLRIASLNVLPIGSTAFERTAALKFLFSGELHNWHREWRSYAYISDHIKRAVIASEDSGFTRHYGVELNAIVNAFEHNQQVNGEYANTSQKPARRSRTIRGGSTITQQLAKNIFLSSEQTYWRKGQELFITLALEGLLSKKRVFELYLNHAQWGQGVYGVQAACQQHFKSDAKHVTAQQAALLAAMLPRPHYYHTHLNAPYLKQRARKVMAGMPLVEIP